MSLNNRNNEDFEKNEYFDILAVFLIAIVLVLIGGTALVMCYV